MNPTELVKRQKKEYWQAKTSQNLANPNRGIDPKVRLDIKYRLDPNLGDVVSYLIPLECCSNISNSPVLFDETWDEIINETWDQLVVISWDMMHP